jgi:hypothetical protein
MSKIRVCKFYGYVKVDLQSQSPRRWVWSVRRDSSDMIAFSSDAPFAHAEDAWSAGQKVLNALEEGTLVDPLRLLTEVD